MKHRSHHGIPWKRHFTLLAVATLLFLSVKTAAHRPLFTDSRSGEPESAVRIADPSTSHVIYAALTEAEPVQWFVLQNEKPQKVPLTIGVPSGISADDFRPVIIIFGPETSTLPEEFPPSPAISDDAIVIRTDGDAEAFYEPITGTHSWILAETEIYLAESGLYYGAVYDPEGREGKLWIGVGRREGFSWRDALRLPGWIRSVRQFHEVPGLPPWAWVGTGCLLVVGIGIGVWLRRRTESKRLSHRR